MMGYPGMYRANQAAAVRSAHSRRHPFLYETSAEVVQDRVPLPYIHNPEQLDGWAAVEGADWYVPYDQRDLFLQSLAIYVESHPTHGFAIVSTDERGYNVWAFRKVLQ